MRRPSTIRRERKEPSPPAGGRAHSSAAEVRRLYAAYRANREPSDDEILQLIDRGLDATAIDELRAIGFSNVEIDDLAIPARTERHRRDREQKLTHQESERVVRLLRLRALAERAFNNRAKADAWLRDPLSILDGRSPLSLARNEFGARHVETLLAKIEWGAAA